MSKQIAITDSFLNSVFKLNNQDRKLAFNTAKQIADNPTAPSLHIHSIDREKCDKKFVSARINLDLRMILVNRGEVSTLLYVDHHDAAYDWCVGKYLVKTNFGAEYIYDEFLAETKIEEFNSEQEAADFFDFANSKPLLEIAGIKKKELEKLGIQDIHAQNLLTIDNEEKLLEYIEIFPEELQEAIIDLATSARKFDEVYNSLIFDESKQTPDNSIRRFYLTEDLDELSKLMENESFEKWTLFLHPSQDRLVNMNCNGPMLIEGGPGTGKTIVGIHRAVKLASSEYMAANHKRILFCTFSKKLASNIDGKLIKLCELKGIEKNIDVMSVDSYIARMLADRALPVNNVEIPKILKRIYETNKWSFSFEFCVQEYYEVIEKYNVKTKDQYLMIDRTGSGIALNKNMRDIVWPFFAAVIREKQARKAYSFVDRAYQLNELIDGNQVNKQYDAIVIDEAQDLEGIKLKVLNKSVKNIHNGICILSDRNQRIFRLNTWSNDAGINVVGRAFYLRINYRTTKQINEYARNQFMDFDLTSVADREYISVTSGEEPTIIACKSEGEENRLIVENVRKLLDVYGPNEICVLAPNYEKLSGINAIFEYEGIKAEILNSDAVENDNNVKLCTTSGVKGLEFSAVVISSFNKIGTQRQNYGSAPEALINYEKLVECEKYVSVTRARDKVLITYVG